MPSPLVVNEVSSAKSFGGQQKVFSHWSDELKCQMKFAIYLPVQSIEKNVPVLFFLSGLTCSEQNFITKCGYQRHASKHGICVVAPDTSPRGCNIEGEDDDWDFGSAASFYVDATEDKWKTNYRMFSYVTKELPEVINSNFSVIPDRHSITGHSMGGHGALICFLKNPGKYCSVSGFACISNPSQCPWGRKAFTGYLGKDEEAWKDWDACDLVSKYDGPPATILCDTGTADGYLSQLLPDNLIAACAKSGVQINSQMQEGYDHSYYFVSTFIGTHFEHHAKALFD